MSVDSNTMQLDQLAMESAETDPRIVEGVGAGTERVHTSLWPDAVDTSPEELTEKQVAVIEKAAIHRDTTQQRLADVAGVSQPTVSNVLSQHWPSHPVVASSE